MLVFIAVDVAVVVVVSLMLFVVASSITDSTSHHCIAHRIEDSLRSDWTHQAYR